MDNGRIMKELKELQEGVKNVSHRTSQKGWPFVLVGKQLCVTMYVCSQKENKLWKQRLSATTSGIGKERSSDL